MVSRFLNQPKLNLEFIRPRRMRFDTPGAGQEGGRNGLGQSISMDFSGGGVVTGTYECVNLSLGRGDDERQEYFSMIGARMNGGFRFMDVSILNDDIGPFPTINGKRTPIVRGIPHSDGSFFSDGSGYSQATVWAKLLEDAPLNAGQVKIRIYGAARDLRWSDWFSIYHNQNGDKSKGWRTWRYWESDKTNQGTETVEGVSLGFKDYTLSITPPLREATAAGTRVEAARPTCVMKFPADFTLPYERDVEFSATPILSFTEAF